MRFNVIYFLVFICKPPGLYLKLHVHITELYDQAGCEKDDKYRFQDSCIILQIDKNGLKEKQ